jgi:hypothetical protein
MDLGRAASAVAISTSLTPAVLTAAAGETDAGHASSGAWDLSWIPRLATATDKAIFDWPSLGDPADPIMLELAARYLDNCASAYVSQRYEVRVVLNIRTQAVPAALTDETWSRFRLGTEYGVKDPNTAETAVHNPFLHRAPSPAPGIELPTLTDMLTRDAIVLVCDFALTNMSKRLAGKFGTTPDAVHSALREGLVPGAFAVPSGIFGLARAQNAGCALVRI